MTAKAAGKAAPKPARKSGRARTKAVGATSSGTGLWWAVLGCGGVVVLSPGTAILLAVLVAPVLLVSMFPEDGPGRRVALASLLFGLAGSIPALAQLWDGGATVSAALAMIHRPLLMFAAWTAVLAGWFVGEIAGIAMKLVADLNAAAKRRACAAELAALEEEWGPLPPMITLK